MKAAQINQPNQLEVIDLPKPEPAEDELLVKVMASGICGTDIHIFRGEYMGDYPLVPGHEFAGVVAAVGPNVTRFQPGDRVAIEPNIACDNCYHCLNNRHNFCLNWSAVGVTRPGGMAQFVTAPEKSAFDIGSLPFEQGAFMEPLSCVLHGVERLEPELASHIAIFGAGPIGILLLQVLRLEGAAEITVVDQNQSRAALVTQMGADQVFNSLDDLPRMDYDAVVDATGAIPVMSRCIDYVRHGGKVLLFGVPPAGEEMSMEAFPIFRKGLTILSSFTSLRNSYQALDLLKHGRISLDGIISHKLPLTEFQRGIELIEQGAEGVKKVIILPNSENDK
jgi:2-desacetyl-2-hydroxyethyl bacteriochlorophyllide A dehydrogenase